VAITMKCGMSGMWRRVHFVPQPPAHTGSSLPDFSTLKMEAIRPSETSVHTRSTWRHIPEDGILYISISILVKGN
jgi:hypothetical protein